MMIVERDLKMVTEDGVCLAADLYRAPDSLRRPALLMRTPYGKNAMPGIHVIDPASAIAAGFVVIVQDVRGRYGSDGDWRPYESEAQDGYAAVEWAASLPWVDGRVGMYGASYQGSTALAAAALRPPALRSIAPIFCWQNPADGQTFRGGTLELGKLLRWTLMNLPDRLRRSLGDGDEAAARIAEAEADLATLDASAYGALPLGEQPLLRKYGLGLEVLDYMDSADRGDFQVPALAPKDAVREVPALWVAGWFDSFLGNMIREYRRDADAGLASRLIVGPWSHANRTRTVGEIDFGPQAEAIGKAQRPLQDVLLDWFIETIETAQEKSATVQMFTMGANEWKDREDFPRETENRDTFYLAADGGLADTPQQPSIVAFDYDPRDPAPTIGGPTLMGSFFPAGPRDQRAISARPDVATFFTPLLTEPRLVEGWITASLWVESSAFTTDFVARLIDVHPDMREIGITDGIIKIAELPPKGPLLIEIDLWATAHSFAAGHRIGLQVTSSSFPRWNRSLNTLAPLALNSSLQNARQCIHVGGELPSALHVGSRYSPNDCSSTGKSQYP